jgi:hypothetical protein
MVKSNPNNRAKGARRARRTPRKNIQKQNQNAPKRQALQNRQGQGAVVFTRMPRIGMTDIRNHRVSWIAGYTFVGNGTNGAANAVLFQTAAKTYIMGLSNGLSGSVPILAGDSQVGASYVSDIEKHFARKVIKRMWLTVASLQPSTSNNMMCVVAASRGPGLASTGTATPLATATPISQVFTNVMSMQDAMTVDSFETKTMEITKFIAGGSGAKQNEFEINEPTDAASTVLVSGSVPAIDLIGLVPASLTVSGFNTTTGLQNTQVHAIIVEQEIDLLDYIGGEGNAAGEPVGVAESTTSTAPEDADVARARAVLARLTVK